MTNTGNRFSYPLIGKHNIVTPKRTGSAMTRASGFVSVAIFLAALHKDKIRGRQSSSLVPRNNLLFLERTRTRLELQNSRSKKSKVSMGMITCLSLTNTD